MNIDTIPEVLDHLVESPLRHNVEINNRNYYIDFDGHICIKGTKETPDGIEDLYLPISSDLLFSEIIKAGVIDFNVEVQ